MTAQKVLSIILGIIVIIGGIYCLCTPSIGIDIVTIIVGIAMIIEGVGNINLWGNGKKSKTSTGWILAAGIISIIIGTALIIGFIAKFTFVTILVYFIVAWLIIIGILRIGAAIKVRSFIKNNKIKNSPISWGWILAIGIIMLLVGILVFFNPIAIGWLIGVIVGISIIAAGCGLIVAGFAS